MCRQARRQEKPFESNVDKLRQDDPEIVDYRDTMLIARPIVSPV
jgi:hypothetical protein